ncbi:MAG: DUF1015 domain-containing protein [Nitrospirae bacterium]|nr:DUF1015 domain-containing protein [Nitrospirota bacterium]
MAKIFPFKGILYNPAKIQDLGTVMTPPYDIISPEAQERFYKRHPHSMIRLDFGKETPQDHPQDNRYTRAAQSFRQWLSEGVLLQDTEPGYYFYRIQYRLPQGEEKVVRGFIALTELEEFGSGSVIPHEYTLSGPKTDRLNLIRACEANFSLIFSMIPTGEAPVIPFLEEAVQGKTPRIDVRDDDGVRHTLWSVTRPVLISKMQKAVEGRSIYIADGHHRYETSVNYRNERRAQGGTFTGQESYNRVMMFFTETTDQGLTILPTHRLIFNIPDDQLRYFDAHLGDYFDQVPYPFTAGNEQSVREKMLKDLTEKGKNRPVFGLCRKNRSEYGLLIFKDPALLDREGPTGYSQAWKHLDVSVLQTYVLEKLLGLKMEAMKKQENLSYVRGEAETIQKIREGKYQMAFLLNPTRMDEIIQVAGAGDRMPQKSTYFYPKLLTGLVIYKL